MRAHPHNTFKAFIVNTEITIDTHIRGLHNAPNDSGTMVAVWPCSRLVQLLIVVIDKMMAQNNLVRMGEMVNVESCFHQTSRKQLLHTLYVAVVFE